jgi:hypothetical protein
MKQVEQLSLNNCFGCLNTTGLIFFGSGGEYMLIGLISGLIVGWLVSLFGGDSLIIQGIFELTGKQISIAGYYTIFSLVGLIGGLIKDST